MSFPFVRKRFQAALFATKIHMQTRWNLFNYYRSPQILGSTNCESGSQFSLLLECCSHSAYFGGSFAVKRLLKKYSNCSLLLLVFVCIVNVSGFLIDVFSASEPSPLRRWVFILLLFLEEMIIDILIWLREPFLFATIEYLIESKWKWRTQPQLYAIYCNIFRLFRASGLRHLNGCNL